MRRQSTGFLEPRRQGRTGAVGGRKRFTVGGGPDPGSDTGSRDGCPADQQFAGQSRWRERVQARVPPCELGLGLYTWGGANNPPSSTAARAPASVVTGLVTNAPQVWADMERRWRATQQQRRPGLRRQ